MWGWDPSQGGGPAEGTPTPSIVPSGSGPPPGSPQKEPLPVLVPDVQDLKQQVQQQQSLLAHMKATIQENDADRSSKQKQLEIYANKLSQIQKRSAKGHRASAGAAASPKRSSSKSRERLAKSPLRKSRENLTGKSRENVTTAGRKSSTPGKMSELLKQRLVESKQKFEEQTEKEMAETKKIESKLEQIRSQVKETDLSIHEMQKTMDTPPSKPKPATVRKPRERNIMNSKYTQTLHSQPSNEVEQRIKQLEAIVVDLEDTVRQQESVIAARTQAVSLLSEDMSRRGKTTVDQLEDTRAEMRNLQAQFVLVENSLKSQLVEKDNRLTELEERIEKLKETNSDLQAKNEQLQAQNSTDHDLVVEQLKSQINQLTEQSDKSSEKADKEVTNSRMVQLQSDLDRMTEELAQKQFIESRLEATISELDHHLNQNVLKVIALEGELHIASEIRVLYAEEQAKVAELTNLLKEKEELLGKDEKDSSSQQQYMSKIAELTKELEDSNKMMIKLKLEHKNKVKALNKSLDTLKKSSNDKAELARLSAKVTELEQVKEKHEAEITELEVEKATIENLKSKISELDSELIAKNTELETLRKELSNHEVERQSWQQNIEDHTIMVDNLTARISALEAELPGDVLVEHFDQSNREYQGRIDDIVQEKQVLLDKLGNLSIVSSLDSVSFEKLEISPDSDLRDSRSLGESIREDDARGWKQQVLGLQNNLIELMDQCQRLRKENIEVVHQLSEVKVRRRELEEELETWKGSASTIDDLRQTADTLENRVTVLETEELSQYAQVIISAKDTEIFTLHSALADKAQDIERLQSQLTSCQDEVQRLQDELSHVSYSSAEVEKVRTDLSAQLADAVSNSVRLQELVQNRERALQELQGSFMADQEKISEAEEIYQEQLDSKDVIIKNQEAAIFEKNSECVRLQDERHRLQVSMETVMADLAVALEKLKAVDSLKELLTEKEGLLVKYAEELAYNQEKLKEVDYLKMQISEKDVRLVKYEEELAKERENLKLIRSEISEKESILAKYNAELANDHEKLKIFDDLKLQITEKNDLLSKYDEELIQLQENIVKLVAERDQLVQSQKESSESYAREREEANLKIDETEKVLQKTWAERNDLIQTNEELHERINAIGNEARVLQAQRNELNAQLTEAQASCFEINTKFETKCKDLESMTVKAKKLAANLKKKAQIEKELLEEVQRLKTQTSCQEGPENLLAELNELRIQLQEEKSDKDDIIRDAEAVCAFKATLEETLTSEQQKNLTLAEELNTVKSRIDAVEEEKNELVRRLESFGDVDSLYKKVEALEQMLELEERENETLLSQRSSMLDEKGMLEIQCQEKHQKCLDLSSQVQQLQDLLQEARDLQKHLSEGCEALQKENLATRQRVEELEVQNSSLVTDSNRLTSLVEELRSEITNLKSTKDKLNETEDKYALLLKDNERLGSEVNEMAAMFGELEKAFTNAKQEANELVAKYRKNETKLAGEKAALEMKISEMELKSAGYDDQVVQLMEKINILQNSTQDRDNLRSELEGKEVQLKEEVDQGRKENYSMKKQLIEEQELVRSLQSCLQEQVVEMNELRERNKDLEESVRKAASGTRKKSVTFKFNEEQLAKEEAANVGTAPESNPFNVFFGTESKPADPDPFSEDSLAWDDGWGTDGHLEEVHALSKTQPDDDKITKLQSELKTLQSEKESVNEDLRVVQVKYSKVVKKLKEQKTMIDRLQAEVKTLKQNAGGGELDAAIIEELRSELLKAESKFADAKKDLEATKTENESLLKRVDVLTAGQEQFLELKERQDTETAVWQTRNSELRSEIAALKAQLEAGPIDGSELSRENKELRNMMEGLEWKISELTELIEEKEEEIAKREVNVSNDSEVIRELQQQVAENAKTKESLSDLEEQMALLAQENETLQDILNQQKADKSIEQPTNIGSYFQEDQTELKTLIDVKNFEIQQLLADVQVLTSKLEEKEKELVELTATTTRLQNQLVNLDQGMLGEMEQKEQQVQFLLAKVEELEKSYNESKAEINRLLGEEKLYSETPLATELAAETEKFEVLLQDKEKELTALRETLVQKEEEWTTSQDLRVHSLKEQIQLEQEEKYFLEKELERYKTEQECSNCEQLHARCRQLEETCTALSKECGECIELKKQLSISEQERVHLTQLQLSCSECSQLRSRGRQLEETCATQSAELATLRETITAKELILDELQLAFQQVQQRTQDAESWIQEADVNGLKQELASKQTEVEELKNILEAMREEVSAFRRFDQQVQAPVTAQPSSVVSNMSGNWSREETVDMAIRLQSDLDTALNMLHQRDVRCDELTFELMQLLEERDMLQLRLSTAIRTNEEMRTQRLPTAVAASFGDSGDDNPHLAEKISELHNTGYRDKTIQDDSLQRHRDQMTLLSREARSHQVLDV